MYFYPRSNRLPRLCLQEFVIIKQSRKILPHTNSIHVSKIKFSIKGKSESSSRWLRRQAKDPYVHQAVKDGYRCRSAYKLLEIDDKFHILTSGSRVVDCGASPGSWSQVAIERIKSNKNNKTGVVIAVDVLDIREIPGTITMGQCDFTHSNVQQQIIQLLPQGQADVIMSDMAPLSTGNKKLDHFKIVDLNMSALKFAKTVLTDGGCFLCKLWDGDETGELIEEISESFSHCKQVKPKASRMDSSELFILGKGFVKK